MGNRRNRKAKEQEVPVGIEALDRLATSKKVRLEDYIAAASAYVLQHGRLSRGPKKAAQIRLSNALGRVLAEELHIRLPPNREIHVGERKIAGGLRTANADLSESDSLDGLRLAVEIKPINLAVGRAIWNRFGDLRAFSVNVHLKFPFCVVGGVLVLPTVEEIGTRQSLAAEKVEEVLAEDEPSSAVENLLLPLEGTEIRESENEVAKYKPTRHLIEKAVGRLVRARGRNSEADAAHLLEAIAVIVYDPLRGVIDESLPSEISGLRWAQFVDDIATAYQARFEG